VTVTISLLLFRMHGLEIREKVIQNPARKRGILLSKHQSFVAVRRRETNIPISKGI
jgi:hypothetical protein